MPSICHLKKKNSSPVASQCDKVFQEAIKTSEAKGLQEIHFSILCRKFWTNRGQDVEEQ